MLMEDNATCRAEPASTIHAPDGSLPGDRWTGTTLGKYHIVRRLGRGGMGVVYEVQDPVLQRSVAIKVLRDGIASQPEAVRKFLREARIAARLNHPHIVGVYEADQERGMCFLVMELMEGGSAHDRIRTWGSFDWVEATRVLADACRGLAAVHGAGLIHRDIKPSNIMRARDGTVKLADFGLAFSTATADSATQDDQVVGTPLYMSPEQCRGEKIDRRSDIYSLGATYFTLLTGLSPFDGPSPMDIMRAHCSLPIPDPREVNVAVPPVCTDLIRGMMAKAPADRPASAGSLLEVLERILAQAKLPEYRALDWVAPSVAEAAIASTIVDRLTAAPAPHRTRLWFVGACLILMGFAFGIGRFYSKPEEPAVGSPIAAPTTSPNDERLPEATVLKSPQFDAGGSVTSLAFNPIDSEELSWATNRGRATVEQILYRTDKKRDAFNRVRISPLVEQAAYSPTGKLWATLLHDNLRFFETPDFKRTLDDPAFDSIQTGPILSFAFHPRERIVALSFREEGTNKGGIVFRWLKDKPQDVESGTADHRPPTCIAFSTDGSLLLQGKESGIAQVWKVELRERPFSGEKACVVKDGGAIPVGHGVIRAIAGLNESRFAVAIGNQVVICDGSMGRNLKTIHTGQAEVSSLAVSPRTKRIAWSSGNTVAVYDLSIGIIIHEWTEHAQAVRALAFDAKGEKLASGDEAGRIVIHSVE